MDPLSQENQTIFPNARRGEVLCCLYLVLFVGFVFLNMFWPADLTQDSLQIGGLMLSFGGPNVALVLAIGLIFLAVLLALLYIRPGGRKNP